MGGGGFYGGDGGWLVGLMKRERGWKCDSDSVFSQSTNQNHQKKYQKAEEMVKPDGYLESNNHVQSLFEIYRTYVLIDANHGTALHASNI